MGTLHSVFKKIKLYLLFNFYVKIKNMKFFHLIYYLL
jgi:hypothetical protein